MVVRFIFDTELEKNLELELLLNSDNTHHDFSFKCPFDGLQQLSCDVVTKLTHTAAEGVDLID